MITPRGSITRAAFLMPQGISASRFFNKSKGACGTLVPATTPLLLLYLLIICCRVHLWPTRPSVFLVVLGGWFFWGITLRAAVPSLRAADCSVAAVPRWPPACSARACTVHAACRTGFCRRAGDSGRSPLPVVCICRPCAFLRRKTLLVWGKRLLPCHPRPLSTAPTIACPPSFTLTCCTTTFCSPPQRYRFSASICMANVRASLFSARSDPCC